MLDALDGAIAGEARADADEAAQASGGGSGGGRRRRHDGETEVATREAFGGGGVALLSARSRRSAWIECGRCT